MKPCSYRDKVVHNDILRATKSVVVRYRRVMRARVDLLNDPIDSSLRLFAVPMAFSFLVNMIYSLIDRYYVSRLGDAAIAAIGSSDTVAFVVFTLASGFGVGTGIIVSRRFGERNLAEASRTATQAMVGMAFLGGIITTALYLALPLLPSILRMQPDVAPLAMDYMGALFIGFAANVMNFQMFAIIRSMGNAVFPMVVLLSTTVVNAAIAPLLIFGFGPIPALGMTGAGLATASAQIFGTIIALTAFAQGKAGLSVDFSNFRLDLDLLLKVARQGFPASLQMLSVALNRIFIFSIVGGFGTSVVAAYTLGLNVDMLVFMCVFAMGMAVEVATGQNLGAGKEHRVWGFHRSAAKQMIVLMSTLAIVVWIAGTWFIELYTTTPQTVSEATTYFHTSVFGYVFFAVGLVTVRVISGAGAAVLSMTITAGTLLGLQLPLAWILSHLTPLKQHGVWIALAAGYLIFCVVAILVLRSKIWLRTKV